jgi:hypothetical protein
MSYGSLRHPHGTLRQWTKTPPDPLICPKLLYHQFWGSTRIPTKPSIWGRHVVILIVNQKKKSTSFLEQALLSPDMRNTNHFFWTNPFRSYRRHSNAPPVMHHGRMGPITCFDISSPDFQSWTVIVYTRPSVLILGLHLPPLFTVTRVSRSFMVQPHGISRFTQCTRRLTALTY